MEKQKRDLMILGVIAVAGILAGDWFLILSPMFQGFARKTKDITKISGLIADARTLVEQDARIKAKYEKQKEEFELYSRKLPKEKDIPELLEKFNIKAEEAGIKFVKMESRAPISHAVAEGVEYIERQLSVKITSGYHQIADFINRIETLARFVELKEFKIYVEKNRLSSDDKEASIPKAELLLSTYIFSEKESFVEKTPTAL